MSSDSSNDFLLSLVSEPLVARIGSGTALPFWLTGVQKYGQDKKNTARALLSTHLEFLETLQVQLRANKPLALKVIDTACYTQNKYDLLLLISKNTLVVNQ